jgi:hypothetical protein
MPAFEEVSFQALEAEGLDGVETYDLHKNTMLYFNANKQGLVVSLNTLGNNGIRLRMTRSCFDPSRKHF